MTREEIIEMLIIERNCVERQDTPLCNRHCESCDLVMPTEKVVKAYEQAIDILHQEPCEDAVSREAVDEIKELMTDINGDTVYAVRMSDIRQLPSVNPQKSGKWILMYEPKNMVVCSECGKCAYMYQDKTSAFCPHCGAKMVEPQESEDKG